jgi:hypothetical protein
MGRTVRRQKQNPSYLTRTNLMLSLHLQLTTALPHFSHLFASPTSHQLLCNSFVTAYRNLSWFPALQIHIGPLRFFVTLKGSKDTLHLYASPSLHSAYTDSIKSKNTPPYEQQRTWHAQSFKARQRK